MKILIVDDNADKVKRVIEVIKGVPGCEAEDIDVAYHARDARQRLLATSYDLMILDVALPEWADEAPKPEVGIGLLREVSGRPRYHLPKNIVGLTAYSEALTEALPQFANELWPVIQYDATAMDWVAQLQRKLKYLLLLSTNREAVSYGCELCVITALQSPEHIAVLDLPWDWELVDVPNEVTNFHEGTFPTADGPRKVIACCSSRMGMTAAAIVATKAIHVFRPRFLGMVGIAAGLKGECNLGDIIVGDPVWDYGSGKWASKGSKTVFEIAPHQLPLSAALKSKFELLAADAELLQQIRSKWRGSKPETILKVLIGPLASGSAVRADGKVVSEVKAQHRKAVGIEMEGYGVMSAGYSAPLPEVRAFVAKSACDFADAEKRDEYQAYAAYTSASLLKALAENHLVKL